MQKLFMTSALGWHQGFHAMAMKNNAREAYNTLIAMFSYQNELGSIPNQVSDQIQTNWLTATLPIFGFASCYILDHFDLSALTIKDYHDLYNKLADYTTWWFTHRDHAKTGFPSYYHVNESGFDSATLFLEGFPIQSADLQAYMVMLCEACSRLADFIGKGAEAERWMNESKRVLRYLTDELWNGEQFLARLPKDGNLYKCDSIAQLLPIMLGKRLPAEIIAKLKTRLIDENEYLTESGISFEHLRSYGYDNNNFTCEAAAAQTQCLIILGLYDAGEKDAARLIATHYLNALISNGFVLAIPKNKTEPVLGNEDIHDLVSDSADFLFSPLAASIFLILASEIQ
jgi:glycogen debranching enzyme